MTIVPVQTTLPTSTAYVGAFRTRLSPKSRAALCSCLGAVGRSVAVVVLVAYFQRRLVRSGSCALPDALVSKLMVRVVA